MVYTPTYTSDDLSEVGVDLAAGAGAEVFGYLSLIVIVVLGVWVIGKFQGK